MWLRRVKTRAFLGWVEGWFQIGGVYIIGCRIFGGKGSCGRSGLLIYA